MDLTLAASVIGILNQLPRSTSAKVFQRAAHRALVDAGLHPRMEVHVDLPGRKRSRIDITVQNYFAIELDRLTPRRKSIAKVKAFGSGLVYCRESRTTLLLDSREIS